jgi:putative Mg2+ transporter-C (MgtC) family protein
MSPLSADLSWHEIAVRLVLTLLCATLFGLNREAHGGAAGLRTTILVCLAASVAMIQANILLPTAGRPHDSYVNLDLMRLPLGILSGVGFLGAGVIFRRRDLITGVTTAAILWFATVIGLCLGGGQLGLGLGATALGAGALSGLKRLERVITHELRASLFLASTRNDPSREDVVRMLEGAGFWIEGEAVRVRGTEREVLYDVRWRGRRRGGTRPPAFVGELASREGVTDVRWRPQGINQPRS